MENTPSATPGKAQDTANTTNLDPTRKSLLDEVGDIQFYPIKEFLGTVLPAVTDDELDCVKAELSITLSKLGIFKQMSCFKPSLSHEDEGTTFAPKTDIFNKVADAVLKLNIGLSVMILKDDPTNSPQGDVSYNTRPDACYCLCKPRVVKPTQPRVDTSQYRLDRETPKDLSWADAPGTEEYSMYGHKYMRFKGLDFGGFA